MPSQRRVFSLVFIAGVLLWATLNALSWFVWSRTFTGLFVREPVPPAGIGFPLLVWSSESTADSFFVNVASLLLNLLMGVVSSLALAVVAQWVFARGWLPQWLLATDHDEPATARPPQYSLRALLLATTIVAILLGLLRYETNLLRAALVLVCLAGPGMISLAGFLARRFSESLSNRVALGLTLLLMIIASVLGELLGELQDFTRALMALFVCWTPQFVLIALGVKLAQEIGKHRRETPQNGGDVA